MPFKTKKHKLKASTRRYEFLGTEVKIVDWEKNPKTKQIIFKNPSEGEVDDISYVWRDITKIILLSTFIIIFQILASLGWLTSNIGLHF